MVKRPFPVRRLLAAAACLVCFAGAAREAGAEPRDVPATTDAIELHRAATTPGSTKTERELAQYHLAIALYRLELRQAAYAIFAEIADDPKHARYSETLFWLAKLASHLPEPADIVERVGKYDGTQLARFDTTQQRELYWQLEYLLGQYKYRNRQYGDALGLFAKVDRRSKHYLRAQFFIGITSTQLRRPREAAQAFERIVGAIDAGGDDAEDPDRMRDLALLSLARTYYSASPREDALGQPAIDRARLAAAMKYWSMVSVSSEYWLDALFEQSWGYFMTGDHARALGNLHTVTIALSPGAYQPGAAVLRSFIYLANCQYEDTATLAARFHETYQPIENELAALLRSFRDEDRDEAFYRLLKDLRDGKANLAPRTKMAAVSALGDRQLLRHLQYVQMVDAETRRLAEKPASFRESALGADVRDALELARDIAVRNTGELARERLRRALGELQGHLADNARVLAAAMAGRRGAPEPTLAPWRVPAREAERNVVRPGDERDGVLWPFEGEFWRDEVAYRQSIRSLCK